MDPLVCEEFADKGEMRRWNCQCYFPIPRACSPRGAVYRGTRASKVDRDEMKKTLIGQVILVIQKVGQVANIAVSLKYRFRKSTIFSQLVIFYLRLPWLKLKFSRLMFFTYLNVLSTSYAIQ